MRDFLLEKVIPCLLAASVVCCIVTPPETLYLTLHGIVQYVRGYLH